jgi:hypothetical protein
MYTTIRPQRAKGCLFFYYAEMSEGSCVSRQTMWAMLYNAPAFLRGTLACMRCHMYVSV